MKLFLELNQDQILGILEVYTSDNSVLLKLKSSAQNFTHNKDQIFPEGLLREIKQIILLSS